MIFLLILCVCMVWVSIEEAYASDGRGESILAALLFE